MNLSLWFFISIMEFKECANLAMTLITIILCYFTHPCAAPLKLCPLFSYMAKPDALHDSMESSCFANRIGLLLISFHQFVGCPSIFPQYSGDFSWFQSVLIALLQL